MKIAIDAMGGDFAPQETVCGAIDACREFGADVILVGIEADLKKLLVAGSFSNLKIDIFPASEVISMDEHPANAVKRKLDSSLVVANRLVKEGKAAAVISAGNTGAAMAASLLNLGRISGIKRPGIASLMPTKKGFSVLIDAGGNVDCEPEHLFQFGIMGSIYAEEVLGLKKPRLGLLSIGEEETKGNKLTIETYQLLKKSKLNFIGNIEGCDVHQGDCEVIICDGFIGNTVLKLSEGLATVLLNEIKEVISSNYLTKFGGLLLKNSLKKIKSRMDYAEYGGMPLLGVNGISMISHGGSNAKAIKNAIKAANKVINQDIVSKISASLRMQYAI